MFLPKEIVIPNNLGLIVAIWFNLVSSTRFWRVVLSLRFFCTAEK